ncbi:MAG: GTP-binding protein [Candidatus Thorarchaeota archaeon]|nr:MAG: GTP-binding protein [Candidatus Thorarchaeota archaeon]
MIHNVLLIDKIDGGVVTRQWFWKIEFGDADIQEFLVGWKDLLTTDGLAQDTPIFVNTHKIFHSLVGDELLLIFVTDGRDEDRTIQHKVREGASRITTALRGNSIGYIRDNLEDILGELIFTRFKISFVGSGGVGKSTLMRLLFGREPAPGGYVPTINVAVDSSETIQFGTYLMTIWDFAGQAVFQDLWSFYFGGTDVIFLITDSSFRNVMQTKGLLRNIRKEAPAVPLFIVANKQDLPESMRGEKIQRLLGAHTFAMVATDKTRREEFIKFMLEVATKTVGVTLPDMPVSDMIVVRRRTEEVDASLARVDPTEAGFEDVPYIETEGETGTTAVSDATESTVPATVEVTATGTEPAPPLVATGLDVPPRILHLMLIVQGPGQGSIAFHLSYEGEEIDVNSVASLISALDTFGGIDAGPDGRASSTDALETIEHEGNLVMIEKSTHFVVALIVTNDSQEEEQRGLMTSLLVDFEQDYMDVWDSWDGDPSVFEPSVFDVLKKLPLAPVSLDYIARSREAGRPLPFNNMEVGRALVAIKNAIDGSESVGGIVRSIDLPRDQVLGCLQIMNHYGWIDFQVEVAESSILRKIGPPPEEIVKAYGQVIVQFIQMCDGTIPLEDIVRRLNVSMTPMKFVTQKLVLGGILEVVA